MTKKVVSRYEIIKGLIKKEYKSVRPTAIQMLAVIKKYDLLKYNEQGKRRSKEVMKEAIAKAYAKLR
jgi:hypothetical protein